MTTTTVTEILEKIRTLSPEEQADFDEQLYLMRVDAQNDAWEPNEEEIAEIRRRLKSVDDGAPTYSWEEVKSRMRAVRMARAR